MSEKVIRQDLLPLGGDDPRVFFGPLSTNLSELLKVGFHLLCICWVHQARYKTTHKIHLVRDREKYLIGKIPHTDVSKAVSGSVYLSSYIQDKKQLMGGRSIDDRAPLDQLLLLYPRKVSVKKKEVLIGNRSLLEIVKDLP